MKTPRSVLIQYQGGGYDGCHWEWNYLLFDARGKFHVIAASGRKGITNRQAALDLLAAKPDKFGFKSAEFYSYSLKSTKALNEFQSKCAATHVAGVVEAVNTIVGKPVMFWKCDGCLRKQHSSEMFHDGYRGNGGIGVQMLGKLCVDCYSIGICDRCSEYDADDKIKATDSSGNELYCCEYCSEALQSKESA